MSPFYKRQETALHLKNIQKCFTSCWLISSWFRKRRFYMREAFLQYMLINKRIAGGPAGQKQVRAACRIRRSIDDALDQLAVVWPTTATSVLFTKTHFTCAVCGFAHATDAHARAVWKTVNTAFIHDRTTDSDSDSDYDGESLHALSSL